VNVPGVIIKNVQSVEEVLHFMEFGQQNRAIGATAMNERSSRSHSVFTIHVSSESRLSGSETHACLHLIDLAGSERVGRSEATGERLKEAQHINKSLSALGDVISALASKQGHIPYRNSKLTHLLQDSLNGNAKVLMLSHIAPEEDNCSETISTLHFATRVSNVTLGKAKKNLVANTKKQEEDLTKKEDEIRKLRSLLAAERKTTKELKKKTSVEKSPKASARRQSFDNRKPIRPASAAVTRRRSLENQNPVRPASAITKKQSPQVEQRDSSRRPLSAANSLRAKPADKTKSRWM
jgi:kinesin family protein C2/C3